MKTAPSVQPSTVPYHMPASEDSQYPPPPPKTRSSSSSSSSVARRPLSSAEKAAVKREVEQACRAFMVHLNQVDGEGPTPDFGDEQLSWYDNLEGRLTNLVYLHRSLLRSLISRQAIDPKVLACLSRLCALPEADGRRKDIMWGLPNWIVASIMLWIGIWNPNTSQGSEQLERFSTFLAKQARNQISTMLDICRLQIVTSEYLVWPPSEQCKMPRLFVNRLGLPPLPVNCFVAILRLVNKTFPDQYFKTQVEDLYTLMMTVVPLRPGQSAGLQQQQQQQPPPPQHQQQLSQPSQQQVQVQHQTPSAQPQQQHHHHHHQQMRVIAS